MRRALFALLFVTGCADGLVRTKVAVPTFESKPDAILLSREKVAVKVVPLGYAELEAGKFPRVQVRWRDTQQVAGSSGRMATTTHERASSWERHRTPGPSAPRTATKTHTRELPLLPLPSFAIAIVNESAAAIDFADATITLEGKSGKKFGAMLNPVDVASRVDVLTRERYPRAAEQQALLDKMREAVLRLPLIATTTSIAAGQRFDGMLVIDFAAFDMAELDRALGTDREFMLTLENLGGDSAPLAIKIPLDKTAVTITARCPEGKPATAQTCKLGVE